MTTLTVTMEAQDPQDISSKVLRRAQVSKMTRALQDRLALASLKCKNGWQHRTLDSLEPELQELKRKRSDSHGDPLSDTSSVASARCFSSTNMPTSSPLTQHFFSDEPPTSGSSHSNKRFKMGPPPPRLTLYKTRQQTRTAPLNMSTWKRSHKLPQSSPIGQKRSLRARRAAQPSFSESPVFDSPSASEDDDQDIPLHSFQVHETNISSSPPRTPPHNMLQPSIIQSSPWSSPSSSRKHPVKEGADLLLYLASSPSPGMRAHRSEGFAPPSTPPSKNTALPSSMIGTPGGLFGFAPVTPGNNFNFSDFVNVTPSPAQAAFPKTPGTIKTPNAAREMRRRQQLTPLVGLSPNGGMLSPRIRLASSMELGGEL